MYLLFIYKNEKNDIVEYFVSEKTPKHKKHTHTQNKFLKKYGGICIVPTQPFWAAVGTESRVCYPGNTSDRQTQKALTYYHLSQSTANQNGKLIHCHS
jgi:hypothetical protein